MNKQLENLRKMDKMLSTLEDVGDNIYNRLEEGVLDAIIHLERKIAEQDIDTTDYEHERYKFNKENL